MHPSATQTTTVVGAIPARYGSTRMIGKPLRSLAGRPLIEHVYRRAERAPGLSRVVVLTDDDRIAEAIDRFGGNYELTPTECASGTDRIAWAAREWEDAAVVNIQGDEPLIDPEAIDRLAQHLIEYPDDGMVTLAAPAGSEDADDPNVVKVVADANGHALYFSRSAIPYQREPKHAQPYKHIGIYGYQRTTLLHLAGLDQSPLELAESLEQLRALENGIRIRVLTTKRSWLGVDTMQDLAKVEKIIKNRMREDRDEPREVTSLVGDDS